VLRADIDVAGKIRCAEFFATETRKSAQPKPMPSTGSVDHVIRP